MSEVIDNPFMPCLLPWLILQSRRQMHGDGVSNAGSLSFAAGIRPSKSTSCFHSQKTFPGRYKVAIPAFPLSCLRKGYYLPQLLRSSGPLAHKRRASFIKPLYSLDIPARLFLRPEVFHIVILFHAFISTIRMFMHFGFCHGSG